MNGYTQINIGGKVRGYKWGKWALEFYMRSLNLKENETVEGVMGTENFDKIVYAGLRMNCYMKQTEPDFTFEDVVNWVEVIEESEILKVNTAIEDAPVMQSFLPKKKEAEELPLKSGGLKSKKKGSLPLAN